jgi:hypothetical protein
VGRDFVREVRRTPGADREVSCDGCAGPYLEEPDTRSFPIRRFPYQIVYVELEKALEVVAIAADSQRPGYRQER